MTSDALVSTPPVEPTTDATAELQPCKFQLWWLHPSFLFACIVGGTMLAAVALPPSGYELYDAPKYVGVKDLFFAAACIIGFAVGGYVVQVFAAEPIRVTCAERAKLFRWWLVTAVLTTISYCVWLLVALLRGLNWDRLQAIWNIDENKSNAIFEMTKDYFPTIPGVTTCTQLNAVVFIMAMLLLTGKKWRPWLLVPLFFLTLARVFVLSERLAMIEIAIPCLIMWLRRDVLVRNVSARWQRIFRLAPLAGVVSIFLIFGAGEYFRSWRFYEDKFDNYPQFVLWRLSGYYTTCHNNGALLMEARKPLPLPYYTLNYFWRFPLITAMKLGYEDVTGIEPYSDLMVTLRRFGNEEMNNQGGLYSPAFDYGYGGAIIFWMLFGMVCMRLYRGYLAGSVGGLLLYPIAVVSLMETPRILYLLEGRAFPPITLVVIIALYFKYLRFQAAPNVAIVNSAAPAVPGGAAC
jgi:hypothetical protein